MFACDSIYSCFCTVGQTNHSSFKYNVYIHKKNKSARLISISSFQLCQSETLKNLLENKKMQNILELFTFMVIKSLISMSVTSIIIFFALPLFFTETKFLKFFFLYKEPCAADNFVDSHYIIV